nr:uncharacterized protein LOC105348129 [Crassostrea gigas]
MASWVHVFLIVHLLLIQGYMNENIHCKEAVESVETVSSCPTSKEQWDKASSRKKCWETALEQTCSDPQKFVYHCVINGYGNATLEVCAPERLILGHCTEFNEVGGVIQDQLFTKCNGVFPKCDDYYLSSEAYKYEDCYKIVEAKKLITSTSKNVKHVPSDEKVDGDESTVPILAGGILASGFVVLIVIILYVKRRKISRWKRGKKELSGDIILFKRTYVITDTGLEEKSDQQHQNKPGLSSECRNDDSEVLSESQSLLGQVYDQNTLGVSKVKRRQQ